MKVYKSQTQATDEPGNIQFGIRQNPSLSSAGSIAKANFGNTVQQVGNQMGQIAIKVQEIKNATEVSRVKNEYTKINSEISSFVPHAPHFFDVATWSEKERNKARIALLKGQPYSVNYPVGSIGDMDDKESQIYNMQTEDKPYGIVSNSAVLKTLNAELTGIDVLQSNEIQGAYATKSYNDLIAETEKEITALTYKASQGDEIAMARLFGSEEVLNENGEVIIPEQPGILTEKLQTIGYGDKGYQGYLDQQQEVAKNIVDYQIIGVKKALISSSVDDEAFQNAENTSLEYIGNLLEKENGEYTYLPHLPKHFREEKILEIETALNSARKEKVAMDNSKLALEKRQRDRANVETQNSFYEQISNFSDKYKITIDPKQSASLLQDATKMISLIDTAVEDDDFDGKMAEALKTEIRNVLSGKTIVDIPGVTMILENALIEADDREDYLGIIKDVNSYVVAGYLNSGAEYLKTIRSAMAETPANKRQNAYASQLRNLTNKPPEFNVGPNIGPQADALLQSVILSNFRKATNEGLDGTQANAEEMQKIFDQSVQDYYRANRTILQMSFTVQSEGGIPGADPYVIPNATITNLIKSKEGFENLDLDSANGWIEAHRSGLTKQSVINTITASNLSSGQKELELKKLDTLFLLLRNAGQIND